MPEPLLLIKLQASGCDFIIKGPLEQVFFCEFCKISKNTFYYRTPPVAVSQTQVAFSNTGYLFSSCLVFCDRNDLYLILADLSNQPFIDFDSCLCWADLSTDHLNNQDVKSFASTKFLDLRKWFEEFLRTSILAWKSLKKTSVDFLQRCQTTIENMEKT